MTRESGVLKRIECDSSNTRLTIFAEDSSHDSRSRAVTASSPPH
jgi:hypothetical protein